MDPGSSPSPQPRRGRPPTRPLFPRGRAQPGPRACPSHRPGPGPRPPALPRVAAARLQSTTPVRAHVPIAAAADAWPERKEGPRARRNRIRGAAAAAASAASPKKGKATKGSPPSPSRPLAELRGLQGSCRSPHPTPRPAGVGLRAKEGREGEGDRRADGRTGRPSFETRCNSNDVPVQNPSIAKLFQGQGRETGRASSPGSARGRRHQKAHPITSPFSPGRWL